MLTVQFTNYIGVGSICTQQNKDASSLKIGYTIKQRAIYRIKGSLSKSMQPSIYTIGRSQVYLYTATGAHKRKERSTPMHAMEISKRKLRHALRAAYCLPDFQAVCCELWAVF